MNKHDFDKHPIAVGQVWKTRFDHEVTISAKNDHPWFPWEAVKLDEFYATYTITGTYLMDGDNNCGQDEDLVELIYDPNIVAPPKEYIPKFNRKEILQAVLDDKPILFRVDEGETWQEVKDNNWVLRMVADQTEYCFKVKPPYHTFYLNAEDSINWRASVNKQFYAGQEPLANQIKVVIDLDSHVIESVEIVT